MLAIPPGLMRWIFGIALAVSLLAMGCNGPDSRARGSIKAGDEAAQQRALREALNHYRTAAVAEPASLEAQMRRGAMAELLGEFDEALDAYRRASRVQQSGLSYYRAGAMAERMGNTALATEYLNASLQAPPSRGERWAQTGQHVIERVTVSLNGSRWGRMLPDWVFRSLQASRVVLANAVLDREVVASSLFTTLLEAGETGRALEVARARGWVREGADYCATTRGAVGAEPGALVGMLVAPDRGECLLPLGSALPDAGLVRLSRMVLQDRIRRAPDVRARREAETFLRNRLPAHDVPKTAESLNVAAYNLQYRFGDQGAAATAYQKAIAADPKFSWPYANLGRLYMELDQYDLAVDWRRGMVGRPCARTRRPRPRLPISLSASPSSPSRWPTGSGTPTASSWSRCCASSAGAARCWPGPSRSSRSSAAARAPCWARSPIASGRAGSSSSGGCCSPARPGRTAWAPAPGIST